MSTDVREDLRRAAGTPDHGPDITAAIKRGHQLRTRRRGVGAAAGLATVGALVVALSGLPIVGAPPEIGAPPLDAQADNWSEMSRGTLPDGSTWLLQGQTSEDVICIRWHVLGTDRERTNCGDLIDWDDARTDGDDMLVLRSDDHDLIFGHVGPVITMVEVGFADGSTVQVPVREIQQSGFQAYVAETHGRTVHYVTGRDADGQERITIDFTARPGSNP